MRITSLCLQAFRSFVSMEPIDFGTINVFIGANNAGKSSILRSLYLMQNGCEAAFPDVRVGAKAAKIQLGLADASSPGPWGDFGSGELRITISSSDRRGGSMNLVLTKADGGSTQVQPLPNMEPNHFIVPYLSKRKTSAYHEDVRNQHAMQVVQNMSFLAAKLSRISNPSFPGYERYSETCKAILGFLVTAIPSEGGQRPGIYLQDRETIPIDQMGEGVPNIVTLLADLALSHGKLFLIEEPENDLHPTALKALLDVIIDSSKSNQFVISTHSNIVLRHLGAAEGSRVYNVSAVPDRLPTEAEVRAVEHTPQARLEVLRDLGYSFSDFDLWDGWLILEESSAERIIRDYLIPWFAPKLARVRTLAVGGIGQVEPTFEDFHRLVRFTHLEEAYTNAAWVRIDGDDSGKRIVERLQGRYPSWAPDRFASFSNAQFERYYPSEFHDRISAALSVTDKQQRRDAKRSLLNDVREWLDADTDRGRKALMKSAGEIVTDLKTIEAQLLSRKN